MSFKVTPDKYPEIIEVYNSEGKTAAYDLVRSRFGIKNPTCLMRKLKTDETLGYDYETDRFEPSGNKEDDIFLNLDELCENRTPAAEKPRENAPKNERVKAMENMVHTLISDRLLELSKYVLLDPVGKRILVDQSGMQTDGYQVIIH